MRTCKIYDCSEACNKCKECKYREICDYVWVGDIWNKNSKVLTPFNPMYVKPLFRQDHIVTITGHDFCIFNLPKRNDWITIQDIAVGEECRGKGVSKKLIFGLMEKYDKDVFAKCIKDSSAESFWKHIGGIKLDEEQSKKTIVCSYILKNNNKKQNKEELW